MMTTLTSAFSILYSVQITLNNRYWDTSDECRRRYGYWIAKTLAERQCGESEDKLRQSVEFRCAGRIECLFRQVRSESRRG